MILENTYHRQNHFALQSILNNTHSQSLEGQLYIINNIESIELQQNCLLRLKKQREKIQEMIAINQQMQKQNIGHQQQKRVLQKRIEQLEEGIDYKEKFQDLKEQFQKMINSHELAEYQIEQLKIQLQSTVASSEKEVSELKLIIKRQREQKLMTIHNLESIIEDKQQDRIKWLREVKLHQTSLLNKIQGLQRQNQLLHQSFKSQGIELEQNDQMLKKTIKTKEMDLIGYEKIVQKLKKQIKTLKFDQNTRNQEYKQQRQQYLEAIEQARNALKLLKRQKQVKQNQNYQLKQEIRQYQAKVKSLQQAVNTLKIGSVKFKKSSQSYKSKQFQVQQQQKKKLQETILRLKKEIQKHVQDYNLLSIQYKRAKSTLVHKQQNQKQRKWLLMHQFREINKIEKEVSRLK